MLDREQEACQLDSPSRSGPRVTAVRFPHLRQRQSSRAQQTGPLLLPPLNGLCTPSSGQIPKTHPPCLCELRPEQARKGHAAACTRAAAVPSASLCAPRREGHRRTGGRSLVRQTSRRAAAKLPPRQKLKQHSGSSPGPGCLTAKRSHSHLS